MSFVGIIKVVYEMNQIETIIQNSQKKVLVLVLVLFFCFFSNYYYYFIIIAKSNEGKILDGRYSSDDNGLFIKGY